MSKKKVLSLALAVIMIAIISFSTLAWFNDTDEVTNKFNVATSDDPSNPDDIFSVDLWEPVDKDGDGQIEDGERTDEGMTFDAILPGTVCDKKPTVENTGAYDQYIRVVVTLSDANAWVDVLGYGFDLATIFEGHDENLWTRDAGSHDRANDQMVYVYYLNGVLEPGETAVLFNQVKFPTALDQDDMAKLNGGFELKIRADAVQTENLGDGVTTAKQAFAVVNWGNVANTAPQG